MSNIAIITARGGSKRIPRKNIKDFLGKPIIAYSIEAAIESGIFEEVMVSTDDKEIADISMQYGAKVPFYRSAKNSDDYATTVDVISEVLEDYAKQGRLFDWLCCIYPTAPFVLPQTFIDCMAEMEIKKAEGLVPVVKFSYPPQRSLTINENTRLEYKWPENIMKRSQDLKPLYHDAGQFYFAKAEKVLFYKKLIFDCTIPYVISDFYAQDIDTLEDWELAEMKYELMQKKRDNCK